MIKTSEMLVSIFLFTACFQLDVFMILANFMTIEQGWCIVRSTSRCKGNVHTIGNIFKELIMSLGYNRTPTIDIDMSLCKH